MRIVKRKRKHSTVYQVVTGYWFWKKVLSVHPAEANAKVWIKKHS